MPTVTTMKISIDTKEDSHEEIKKVISMLQNLVGDSQEIFINDPQGTAVSPMANIFGDISSPPAAEASSETTSTETTQETPAEETPSESTEDLFAELFSEEELKKMNESEAKPEEENEEEEIKPKAKDKKYGIEFY